MVAVVEGEGEGVPILVAQKIENKKQKATQLLIG
jgi:hypothetical protein